MPRLVLNRQLFVPLMAASALSLSVACGSDNSGTEPGTGTAGTTGAAGTVGASAGSKGSVAGTTGTVAGTSGGGAGATGGGAGAKGGGAGAAGGQAGAKGAAGASGAAGTPGTTTNPDGGTVTGLEKFSFFVTSEAAIRRMSKDNAGFGGDLRFGKADGLSGADEICRQIAEKSMPGSSAKEWRAFLSVTKGPDGKPVHAIDRVGEGPWYDRRGRLLAANKTDLVQTRPKGAHPEIINDLPNEDGAPNHSPDGTPPTDQDDNHDMLTGTNDKGMLFSTNWAFTCHDWTSSNGPDGTPRVGHSWPRGGGDGTRPGGGSGGGFSGENWMSALNEAGCGIGINTVEAGPPDPNVKTVGSGGGYGGFYCFALHP